MILLERYQTEVTEKHKAYAFHIVLNGEKIGYIFAVPDIDNLVEMKINKKYKGNDSFVIDIVQKFFLLMTSIQDNEKL